MHKHNCKEQGHHFFDWSNSSTHSSMGWSREIYYCSFCPATKVKIIIEDNSGAVAWVKETIAEAPDQ
jgi:hypothetical protein